MVTAAGREQRRKAARARWAKTPAGDRKAHSDMMNAAAKQRWYDQVDPERVLDEGVREELAQQVRRAFYARIQAKRRATLERKRAVGTLGSTDPKVPATPQTGGQDVA